MRRCTLVFLAALLTMSISAAPVDVEQARSVALSFLKSNHLQTRSSAPELALIWSDAGAATRSGNPSQDATFYVFSQTEGNGFVVVAGDDLAYPI